MFLTLIEQVYFELDTLITVGIVSGKVDSSDWGSSLALLSTKYNFTCANYLHFDLKEFAECFIISEFNALPMLPCCQRGKERVFCPNVYVKMKSIILDYYVHYLHS